jgi:hypothetical protein
MIGWHASHSGADGVIALVAAALYVIPTGGHHVDASLVVLGIIGHERHCPHDVIHRIYESNACVVS